MKALVGGLGAHGVAAECLHDVRSLDPGAHLAVTLRDFLPEILATGLRTETKRLFREVVRRLDPHMESAFMLLRKMPQTRDGRVDLRFVQGSGFYTSRDGLWLYHKGAGSVEAIAENRLQDRPPRYISFGAEATGASGVFSWGSVLGVKLLSNTAREFLHTLVLMLMFVEESGLTSVEEICASVAVPLAITVMPELTSHLRAGMDCRPEGIKQEVGRRLDAGDRVSGILIVTPSATRATDHRDIDGKWTETANVFRRTLTGDPSAVLHSAKRNPYRRTFSAFERGYAIGFMVRNGFLYDPSSSHLQNFYATRLGRAHKVFVGADLGDAFPRDRFNPAEQSCIFANNISGWRMAESLAPGILDNLDRSIEPNLRRIDAFLCGMRSGPVSRDLVLLFAVAPKSSAVGLALATVSGLQHCPDKVGLYNALLAAMRFKTGLGQVNIEDVLKEKAASKRLTGALLHLRPPSLVEMVQNTDWHGKATGPLSDAARDLLKRAWEGPDRSGAVLAIEWLVEASCTGVGSMMPERLTDELRRMPKNRGDLRRSFGEAVRTRLRETTLRPGALEHPAAALEAVFEETFNGRAAPCRTWIRQCCRHGRPQDVRNWAERMVSVMEGLFKDPVQIMADYLGYMFKTRGLFDLLRSGDATGFSNAISGKCAQVEVFRPYVALTTDDRCRTAMGFGALAGNNLTKATRAIEMLVFPDSVAEPDRNSRRADGR